MTSRRRALSPRGRRGPARPAAAPPLRAGYLEAGLGAVAGSVAGGWVGEWLGAILASTGGSDNIDAGPLFLGIAVGLWLGAVIGGTLALIVRRQPLVWPTAAGLALAWPAMASATGVLQTMLGMGPSFLPYVISTLIAGLAARLVVLRVFSPE